MCTATSFSLFPPSLIYFLKSPHTKGTLENFMQHPLGSPTHVLLNLELCSNYNIPCKKPAGNDEEQCLPTLNAYTLPN